MRKGLEAGSKEWGVRVTRYVLFALIIFTPLARASVQGWAVTTIHMVTLVGLTVFLLERIVTWDWKWIRIPLDKPILILMILCIVSTLFSVHRRTSLWATTLLINYVVIFYLVVHTVRTRSPGGICPAARGSTCSSFRRRVPGCADSSSSNRDSPRKESPKNQFPG